MADKVPSRLNAERLKSFLGSTQPLPHEPIGRVEYELSMRERWEFFGGGDYREWHWRLVDADSGSVLRTSDRGFANLFACVKDAESQGYTGFRDVKRSRHRIFFSGDVGTHR
jgi:hypothetical protein